MGFLRVDSAVNLNPLDNLIGFAQKHPQYIARAAQGAFQQAKPSLLTPLKTYPANPAVHPFVWSTDTAANARARRMYHYLISIGAIQTDGSGYLRTGALADSYDAQLFINAAEIFIEVSNSDQQGYRYTKGRRQVPGHAATGWQQDARIITAWVGTFRVFLIGELNTVRYALGNPD